MSLMPPWDKFVFCRHLLGILYQILIINSAKGKSKFDTVLLVISTKACRVESSKDRKHKNDFLV